MAEWDAEIEVDEALARELIGEQFPELALDSVVLLAHGWDNTVWLVDDAWAFRFPRRQIAVPLVEREIAVLPLLQPQVSVSISAPVFRGRSSSSYPWPFTGAAYLQGEELGSADLTDDGDLAVAAALARFLRELHDPALAARLAGHVDLPVDVNARADMSRRVPRTRAALDEVERLELWERPPAVEELLEGPTSSGLTDLRSRQSSRDTGTGNRSRTSSGQRSRGSSGPPPRRRTRGVRRMSAWRPPRIAG